jgi:ABC-type amino acid transport substrate-binding protein
VTPDRSRTVSFTVPYFSSGQAPVSFFNAGQGLAVMAGTHGITGTASLTAATKVGVKSGTTGAAFVPAETPAKVVEYPEAADAFAALQKGEIDAVIIDIPIIADYIKSNPGRIMLAGGPITEEEYAIAVNKDRPAVLALLNNALDKLRADGTYQTVVQKWFGTP